MTYTAEQIEKSRRQLHEYFDLGDMAEDAGTLEAFIVELQKLQAKIVAHGSPQYVIDTEWDEHRKTTLEYSHPETDAEVIVRLDNQNEAILHAQRCREAQERKDFERLKAKFEGSPS